MNSIVTGWIRTTVPAVVGFGVSWLVAAGILDAEASTQTVVQLSAGLTTIITSVYYLIVRLAAERLPWVGSLLGVNKAPSYD